MDFVVGSGDAGYGHADVTYATHVVARIIEIEHPFRNFDFAFSRQLQTEILGWETVAQRDMLGELIFTAVPIEVRFSRRVRSSSSRSPASKPSCRLSQLSQPINLPCECPRSKWNRRSAWRDSSSASSYTSRCKSAVCFCRKR